MDSPHKGQVMCKSFKVMVHDFFQTACDFNFQNMIDMSLLTSILEECVYQFPLDLVSELLQEVSCLFFLDIYED